MRGYGQIIRLLGDVALPFKRKEEECAILDNRSTYRATVIVIVVGERLSRKIVLGVEPVVVREIEGRAVEGVGAALEGHVDGRAALDAVLSGRKLLNGVFGDGIVAQN